MSHMTLSVESINKGQSVELSFMINCNKDYNINKEEIIPIQNWAEVCFKFIHTDGDTIFGKFTSRTLHEMLTDSCINMSVACEIPKFLDKFICCNHWGEWKSLGQMFITSHCDGVLLYKLNVRVTVNKKEKLTLYAQIYEDTDFTDFHLIAENGTVAVHKAILAANSDVFKTMLLGKWKETAEGNIELAGTTRHTLQHLKDYMYLGTLPDVGLEPLLLLAKCYMINKLKMQCIKKLAESITCENLYELLEFGCMNNLPELLFEILHFTPMEIVGKAYEIKTVEQLSETAGEMSPTLPQ